MSDDGLMSARRSGSPVGKTNDHIVSQMYLRRFGRATASGHQVEAAAIGAIETSFRTSTRNVAAEGNFYVAADAEGVPHHDVERLLTLIEGAAAPAFRVVLDKGRTPSDDALPHQWPPRADVRLAIAWWLAAQILRTAPERERLWRMAGPEEQLPGPLARANHHVQSLIAAVAPLAHLVNARPWGIGFTSLCLLTSDAPVQILNATGDDDPARAVTFWDVYLPLDPHRFLYLPGRMHESRRRLMRDHKINLPGGLAIPLNSTVIETAHRHVIWHPDHDPREWINIAEALAMRRSRETSGATGTVMNYGTMQADTGVERRWLDQHTWDEGTSSPQATTFMSDDAVIATVTEMVGRLNRARQEYDG
jgi:hypothetical protein